MSIYWKGHHQGPLVPFRRPVGLLPKYSASTLTEHFLKFVPEKTNNKILLLLDGYRSHIAMDIADWVKSNNIVLFILPAHTSHLLQPVDVACYGPFQRMY